MYAPKETLSFLVDIRFFECQELWGAVSKTVFRKYGSKIQTPYCTEAQRWKGVQWCSQSAFQYARQFC